MTPATAEEDGPLDVEILAPCVLSGIAFGEAEMQQLVSNYNAVVGTHDAPVGVRIGHADEQVLAQKDGDLALGWVRRLYKVGTGAGARVKATIVGTPKPIRDAINTGAWRKVSPAIYPRWEATEAERNLNTGLTGPMLAHVAYLGMDVPCIRSLADLPKVLGCSEPPSIDANAGGGNQNLPSVQEYLDSLQSQTSLARDGQKGAWGRTRPVQSTVKKSTGAVSDRQVANYFAEQLQPRPARSASDVHRLSDEMAAADSRIGAAYMSRARTAAIPGNLAELMHTELAKLDALDRDRLGKATRVAAAKAPRSWLPVYPSR
jgi:hypothetical protein